MHTYAVRIPYTLIVVILNLVITTVRYVVRPARSTKFSSMRHACELAELVVARV